MSAYVTVRDKGGPVWVFKCSSLDEADLVASNARGAASALADIKVHLIPPARVTFGNRRVYYVDKETLPMWYKQPQAVSVAS